MNRSYETHASATDLDPWLCAARGVASRPNWPVIALLKLLEPQHAGGKEVGERRLDIMELEAGAFPLAIFTAVQI
ncbi:MAG TPA: hypothetical protein VKF83_13415 [Stellaceae bacterium]|nr:hypothetical protein [Stellaceae bacterium]